MEPMIEMYYDEVGGIAEEMLESVKQHEGERFHRMEMIEELFRAVHTIKADSSMMLYDDIAKLSYEYESLLYCYRDVLKIVVNVKAFDEIVYRYLLFLQGELKKIYEEKDVDGNPQELIGDIIEMQKQCMAGMDGTKVEQHQNNKRNAEKTEKKRYYIPGAKSLEHTVVLPPQEQGDTDFSVVAKKMETVVDEMSMKLHKPVKLFVVGECLKVSRKMRDKISAALIHVIRNSVDHGIEDMDTREQLGKSPMALIRLVFSEKDGQINIEVEDDGSGIDQKKVLEKAKEDGLLKKPEEEYTAEEIFELIMYNGFSTSSEVNEYSGRGVGMDVIRHNVEALGGRLKLSSKEGFGTKVEMSFPWVN